MTESTVNLTADEEQACGAAIQELLTIEAMATQLAEESIAAELRDEKGAATRSLWILERRRRRGPTRRVVPRGDARIGATRRRVPSRLRER